MNTAKVKRMMAVAMLIGLATGGSSAAPALAADRSAPAEAPLAQTFTAVGQPDLVLKSFGLMSHGNCLPGQDHLTFQVQVSNVGNAVSPAESNPIAAVVTYDHGVAWGSSAALGSIQPGQTEVYIVTVPYDYDHPDGVYTFWSAADWHDVVSEKHESNNSAANQINIPNPAPRCATKHR